ncbi:helix-turn-helix domain-containing protein [Chryseobacterium sp. G0201]|uniref:helix-turn-helix domain-containing protein n=1 Tax=Chryseobacterium sp. G0201 TaxID=2487065 RepID=UPI000F50F80D|nr:AraC family transcriptional regulator [Chryseobacterium sp. G0201]AZA54677.1 AraC family transcriptional regulator [Chryseobacterium sp. G0201]
MIITDPIKLQKIEKHKKDLVHYYVMLMSVVLFLYALIFTFLIPDKIISLYLYVGAFFLSYSYFIIRKNYSINILVHTYIILASLYNFFIMLAFWNNSVASFVWLMPIPLAAYVFFNRKYVVIYSIFILINIILAYLVSKNFDFNFQEHSKEDVKLTDTFLVISNVAVLALIIYFKDKIRREEIHHEIEQKQQSEPRITVSVEKDTAFGDELFEKIENMMTEKLSYKDVNFNISKLSTELEVNSTYISKAIRQHGFPNFNNYLNIHRINCVKKMLNENDLEKVTLMYIYTEAGFSNQSTFNRVFKQIEKITPSEYINTLQTINIQENI